MIIQKIRGHFRTLQDSGKLTHELSRLAKLQKHALVVNGPHPHFPQHHEREFEKPRISRTEGGGKRQLEIGENMSRGGGQHYRKVH